MSLQPERDPDDAVLEGALRPTTLAEFIGQERVKSQLGLVLEAASRRGRSADHVLLSGPPGLGKTTLAGIIAAELGAPLRMTAGPALQHAGDLGANALIGGSNNTIALQPVSVQGQTGLSVAAGVAGLELRPSR